MKTQFTKTEEYGAWLELFLIHIARFSLAVFTFPVVPCILFVLYDHWFFAVLAFSLPICMVLEILGVKGIWILNGTKDGNLGDPVEIAKKGYENKSKEFLFFWWYSRNFNYGFYHKFLPDHNAGEVYEYEKRINTTGKNKIFQWCTREGTHGKDYTLYRVFENGPVYFRWSWANAKKERWFGAGGSEYKFRMKPIF